CARLDIDVAGFGFEQKWLVEMPGGQHFQLALVITDQGQLRHVRARQLVAEQPTLHWRCFLARLLKRHASSPCGMSWAMSRPPARRRSGCARSRACGTASPAT